MVKSEKGALSKAAFHRDISTWKPLIERKLFKSLFYKKKINNWQGLKIVLKTMDIYLLLFNFVTARAADITARAV